MANQPALYLTYTSLNRFSHMAYISCREADISNTQDARSIVTILDSYACDQTGGSEPLSEFVKQNLSDELSKRKYAHCFLAFINQEAVGLAVCFEGFSTFACKPLINIHDIAVLPTFRHQGVGAALLNHIEKYAMSINCCKITLEVLEGNGIARAAYSKAGYHGYSLDPEMGHALFWQKKLS